MLLQSHSIAQPTTGSKMNSQQIYFRRPMTICLECARMCVQAASSALACPLHHDHNSQGALHGLEVAGNCIIPFAGLLSVSRKVSSYFLLLPLSRLTHKKPPLHFQVSKGEPVSLTLHQASHCPQMLCACTHT